MAKATAKSKAKPAPVAPKPKANAKAAAPAAAPEPRNAALEKAIREEPDSDGAYGVYGDWLSEQGHVRGELATAQLGRNTAVAKKLLDKRGAELLGPLAELRDVVTNIVWRGGFIERARVANVSERSELFDGEKPRVKIEQVITDLVTGPGRFLRELTVGIEDFETNDYAAVIAALAAAGPLPTVRQLYLGDFKSDETELNWSTIGDIGRLGKALPKLERLRLRSGGMKFTTPLDFPNLRDFTIFSSGVEDKSIKLVVAAKWPKLQKLDIMFGRQHYGATTKVATLAPLFAAKSVPALRTLGIKNFEFHDTLLKPLFASKLLAQLEVLDLSMGTLTDVEADLFVAHEDALAHLKSLIVGENYFTAVGIKKLKSLGIGLDTKSTTTIGHRRRVETNALGQREFDGEDYRVASTYE